MCIFNVVLAAFYTYNFMAFISEWSLYLVSALLSVITLRELSQYQSTLPLIYSNLRGHSLQWLKSACAVFALIWIARALAMILELAGTKQFAESIYTLSHIPILFLIGTLALYSQSHTTGFNKLFAELAKPKVGEEKNDANKLLVERMNTLMDTAKIYKDPDLRLDGFADCLDISPRTLTTALNVYCNSSFYEYVNHYRVQDAQLQLEQPNDHKKSIQRIYEEAGFSSKSTFYALFKQQTGKTPSEYRKAF